MRKWPYPVCGMTFLQKVSLSSISLRCWRPSCHDKPTFSCFSPRLPSFLFLPARSEGCLVWHAQANTLCQNCYTILVTCGRSLEREVLSWHWILCGTGCMVSWGHPWVHDQGVWFVALWKPLKCSFRFPGVLGKYSFYFCRSGTGIPLHGSHLECLPYLHTTVGVKCLWFESLWVCLGLSKWAHGWSQGARMKWAVGSVLENCLSN